MMGSTIKRTKVANYCRDVMASLNDVSEKYRESLSSVLGNAFVFGNKEKKGYVRDTISEVVDLVMDAQGTKKGLSELLSSSTYDRIVKSMRVPDWALLYFKASIEASRLSVADVAQFDTARKEWGEYFYLTIS